MRIRITHPGAGELVYEIRSIVEFAKKVEQTGIDITWENIGDPVAKGELVPDWIKQIIVNEITENDSSFGYSPTKGLYSARKYLSESRTRQTGCELDPGNIIFFNGLGDSIHKVYSWLSPFARVLGPSPAYPTHSSMEGAHARSRHITYNLDPKNNWLPDMKDVRDKVHFDSSIAGMLIINPDNPTGMVYPKEVLEDFVKLAKEYDLFLIADEIYANLTYGGQNFVSLAEVAKDVPTIVLRGLSKEVPWPGSRCGWAEFYNVGQDTDYFKYITSIEAAKMNEVCSTTLPQAVLPAILSDKRYPSHLKNRSDSYRKRAQIAYKIFNKSKYFDLVMPKGAFYLSVTLSDEFLANPPTIKAHNKKATELLENELAKDNKIALDKKFCLELLAATGICVVPLSSGFNSHVQGFRMTLLENDEQVFIDVISKIINVVAD